MQVVRQLRLQSAHHSATDATIHAATSVLCEKNFSQDRRTRQRERSS